MTARLIVAILAPLLLATGAMAWMAERWFTDGGYFGHGPMVLVMAAVWGAWLVRRECHLGGGAAWPAIPVAALASLMLYVLHGRGVGFLGAAGWWLATVALLVAGMGGRGARALIGPVGLLLFMLPWPLKIVEDLSLPLKAWSMDIGLWGAPSTVAREGARLLLPDGGRLVVGDVCSGLRGLLALLAFAYVLAAMMNTTALRRAVLVALAAPFAVAMNAARIHILVRVAARGGVDAAGPGAFAHDATGLAGFAVGMLMLWLAARWLKKDGTRPALGVAPPPRLAWTFGALAIIAVGPVVALVEGDPPPARPESALLRAIPTELRPPASQAGPVVVGRDVPLDAAAMRLLRPDGVLSRFYGERGTYHLCVVYGRSRRTRLHAPEICYRGSGWEVEKASRIRCPASFIGAPGHVREIQLARAEERRLTWYWFRSGGVSTAAYGAFAWRALIDPGEPQVLVWVSIPLDAEGLEGGRERLRWFIRELAGSFEELLRRL